MEYYFNANLKNIPPSASLAVSEKARELKKKGIDVITLATGEPDFDTPYAARFAAVKALVEGHTHYSQARGIEELRDCIAKKLRKENGISCDSQQILLTPGAKYAVYEAIAVLVTPQSGDEVMILNPAWVSYGPMVIAAGGVPVEVGLSFENNYKISREILEQHVSERTRALIINYPNNPTGCILTEEETQIVADFAITHNLIVISDEIYERICFDGRKNKSLASIEKVKDRVITINGFSKSMAMTGWRIGYLCGPQQLIDKALLYSQHTISCLSDFCQEGAAASFECQEEAEEMVKSYQNRRDMFVGKLNEIPHVTCHLPQGAFYAWAKFELGDMDSVAVSEFLLEKAHVATVPGASYGKGTDKCVRMSFATAEKDLQEAAKRIDSAVRTYLNGGE
ncbi:putative uncharacterized protein [Blautia hydrogenotrophica CAG:147]|uniref:pyridoxal phosphate-dependent aminotransferase n=1 Tax=Blautia hydrogenotrophica TaxID=53443 RepID=UPI00033BEC2E|nr:pyridoxal phosphate-dependent aminotransferase [Blautia hydrogenotrophica]CCX60249.1 putative uncharacterized protein [Blautia hydrogenotrophica CAG:147]